MVADYAMSSKLVIHGHDAGTAAIRKGQRINVDSGAYATGILTAVRVDADGGTQFLTSTSSARPGPYPTMGDDHPTILRAV